MEATGPLASCNVQIPSKSASTKERTKTIQFSQGTLEALTISLKHAESHVLIGFVHRVNPSQHDLLDWACDNLHSSFERLVLKCKGYFEVQCASAEGR